MPRFFQIPDWYLCCFHHCVPIPSCPNVYIGVSAAASCRVRLISVLSPIPVTRVAFAAASTALTRVSRRCFSRPRAESRRPTRRDSKTSSPVVAAEEELWSGHAKFVRLFGGGDSAYLWINGDQEAALFGELVQHITAPAYAALVAPAARVAAAQARMIIAEVAAVDRHVEPLTRWCALHPGKGGAPAHYRERVRETVKAAKLRVEDLEEDVRQLETFCDTAGVPTEKREKVAEALGATCFLLEKISMHTSLWV